MRELVLLLLVPYGDDAHRRLLSEWRSVCFAAVSCWFGRKPCRRAIGRPIICALGRAARSQMDSCGVPHGDGAVARRHGGLSWKNRGGGAFELGCRLHGFDAALSVGIVPGDWWPPKWDSDRHDEHRRPGWRISVHR